MNVMRLLALSCMSLACSPAGSTARGTNIAPVTDASAPDAAVITVATDAGDDGAASSVPPETWVDDLPSPKGWTRAAPARDHGPVGYACFFFADEKPDRCPKQLRLVALWRPAAKVDETRSAIRIMRRVDPRGAALAITTPRPETPKAQPFGKAASYELPSDGTLFFWVVSGSLLIEVEIIGLKNGEKHRPAFTAWAKEVLARAP